MNKNIKIATILPYKENYTFSKAAAAALWVSDFYKFSKFKKNNFIFGSTDTKDFLTNNYINIKIGNIKSKFSSSTNEYCVNFINRSKRLKFDIIEIHNRPLVFTQLKKKLTSKFILYFHNDPLTMKGSKTKEDRIVLLNSVDKIIFVSKWVQLRFFINLDYKLLHKTEIVYPSVSKATKNPIKEKKITFVGKLNKSKGYDIYGAAIINILDKYKNWHAYSIGDESRNKPQFYHTRHTDLGYLTHKKVLNFLATSEIAVVPSRWEEPFGRTALESSSRGCATIISNRGGLPETSDHSIILEKLNSSELFKEIEKLIIN